MSEFWKKRRPRMTDEEERALWERVRTMPSEAAGAARRRSPWAALWARPAVRFGAPVLAVALVAVVWVAQRAPEAPRPASPVGTMATRAMEKAAPESAEEARTEAQTQAPAPAPVRAPVAGLEARAAKDAPANAADEAIASAVPGEPSAASETPAGEARRRATKEEAGFAAPPPASSSPAPAPAPAPAADVRRDDAQRSSAKAGATQPLAGAREEAEQGSAGMQAYRAMPDPEALLASRVRAIRGGEFASLVFDDVVRPESGGPFRVLLSRPTRGGRVVVTRDADGRWSILTDPQQTQGPLRSRRLLEARTGLAVELIEAVQAGDRVQADVVDRAARRLFEENSRDPGTRELVGWAAAATSATETQ